MGEVIRPVRMEARGVSGRFLPKQTTMVDILRARASEAPHDLAFRFLTDGEQEGPRLTYADLDRDARSVAAGLQEVAELGERALLMFAPGLEFIPAFFGCLYAGVVPVPAYPPRLDRLLQSWQVLENISENCQPKIVLTTRNLTALFGGNAASPQLVSRLWLCTDELDPSQATAWRERRTDLDALALLQYTSGSTALPRGVRVTHRNLIHNQRLMQEAVGPEGTGLCVCWVPLYHDMGLLGGVLQPIYHGTPCLMMSPLGILQKPMRWLQAISHNRARTSGGPNFIFDLCAARVTAEQKAGLDLSSWSSAILGGEPINHQTLDRFATAFGPCGFRREAFSPCYGLAESTLFVTGRPPALPVVRTVSASELEQGRVLTVASDSTDARSFVSCGRTWLDQQITIVHPETMQRCTTGEVGEVWVAGPSVADGYWNRPEETERTFHAFLHDTGEGPFLRTGDLGFIEDGELYITGRLKDMLVIHGRNHYPQDIELTVQQVHAGLRAGCGAAFETWRDGKPLLVVVQEVERRAHGLEPTQLLGDVREAVADRHGLHVHDLQLLETGSIPKTTSGKIQRHRCRLGYEGGTLKRWKGGNA